MSNRGSEPIDTEMPAPVGVRRLAVHYAVLALVTAGVAVFVFTSGANKHAQKQIAGGYDVSAATACLGAKIELAQSGQFVTISNAQSTLSGTLKFVNGRLSGAVHCVTGPHRPDRRPRRERRARGLARRAAGERRAQARSPRTGGPQTARPGLGERANTSSLRARRASAAR